MKVVVQRAENATCVVNGEITGKIDKGFMLLVGFTSGDGEKEICALAKKIVNLRIFEDACGKLNLDIKAVDGAILAISQFTLYADCKHGNRPSFTKALNYTDAQILFEKFVEELKKYDIMVETGVFGEDMRIIFSNIGPTTIILDSFELL